MNQPPVLDALFQALLTNDQTALCDIEANRGMECADLHALVSTDHPGAVTLDLGLGLTSSVCVAPIFEGPRAFFMSRKTVNGSLISTPQTIPSFLPLKSVGFVCTSWDDKNTKALEKSRAFGCWRVVVGPCETPPNHSHSIINRKKIRYSINHLRVPLNEIP